MGSQVESADGGGEFRRIDGQRRSLGQAELLGHALPERLRRVGEIGHEQLETAGQLGFPGHQQGRPVGRIQEGLGPPAFAEGLRLAGEGRHHAQRQSVGLQGLLGCGGGLHHVIPAEGPEEVVAAALQRHALLGIGGEAAAMELPAIGVDGDRLAAGGGGEQEVGSGEGAHPLALANRHL